MMNWLLAWRNLWRNPRRTAIILVAVVVGVWLMLFMGAYSRGTLDDLVHNSIYTLTGHIQIHAAGYLNDPSPERSFQLTPPVMRTLDAALPAEAKWAPRVRLDAVAETAHHTGAISLVGMDIRKETGVSFLPGSLFEGTFPGPNQPDGIVVGEALLKTYETKLGHKLILTVRTADGDVTSRAFHICGVFRSRLEQTEKRFAFCRLAAAQSFFKLEDSISELAIMLPDMEQTDAVTAQLRHQLGDTNLVVSSWKDLLPTVRAYTEIWTVYLYIWYLIVFVAMGFGLTNTLLMAVYERMREFGLVRALGLKPSQIVVGVEIEAALLLVVGLALGNLLNWVTVAWFSVHGIDMSAFARGAEYFGMSPVIHPVLNWHDMVAANLLTVVLGLFVSLYPAWKAGRFTPVQTITRAT